MEDLILARTTTWGSTWKFRGAAPEKLYFKEKIRNHTAIIDHSSVWAIKPRNQRGPAREEQTLLLSFAYAGAYNSFNLDEFIIRVNQHGLHFHSEPCEFRGINAYKVIIYDTDVDLDVALRFIDTLPWQGNNGLDFPHNVRQ
jgi:hypothetical protein